jgi:DNA modification methylase
MKKSLVLNQKPIPIAVSNIFDCPINDLREWPGNPRKHSSKQIAVLKGSIKEFSFLGAIVADERLTILSGHGRHLAAKELQMTTVPVCVVSGLTEAQKRAYMIGDNGISDMSSFDTELLKSQLELLIQVDYPTDLTGLGSKIDLMFEDPAESTSNDPAELQPQDVPLEVVSRLGDLWVLGNHRLLCGNALDAKSYALVLDGRTVELSISDPPYNVRIADVTGKGRIRHREFAMAVGEMSSDEFTAFLNRSLAHLHSHLNDGAIVYVFMDWRHISELLDATRPLFGAPKQLCIWTKNNAGMGSFYRSGHELIFVFKHGSGAHINNFGLGDTGRYRTNVWAYPGANTFSGNGRNLLALHPTPKPVGLIADALRDCSHRGGLVFDMFAGSGTIIVAAERTKRHACGIELDPRYIDVSINRWQRVTSKHAILASSGQTWEQVREDRLKSIA